MKKKYLTTLFFALSTATAVSAQEAYTKIGIGYAMPLPFGGPLTVDGFPMTGSGYNYPINEKYEISHASLNTGLMGSIRMGYRVKNTGIEAGLLIGLATNKNIYQTENALQSKITIYSRMPVMFNPAISYQKKKEGNSIYGSVGLCMPLSKKIYTETESTSADNVRFFDKTEMTTKFTVGFTATLGYKVHISHSIYFFGELSMVNISFLTRQSDLIECTADGKSILDSRYESQKHVNYGRGVDVRLNNFNTDNIITIDAYRMPFNNYGLNIGLGIDY